MLVLTTNYDYLEQGEAALIIAMVLVVMLEGTLKYRIFIFT